MNLCIHKIYMVKAVSSMAPARMIICEARLYPA